MHRFFVHRKDILDDKLYIKDKNELKHMEKVLRLKTGDKVIVFDGQGMEYEVIITDTSLDCWVAEINHKIFRPNNANIRLSLVQGIAKGDKMDMIIQKAVEIGVDTIYPILTEHTVVKYVGDKGEKKVNRWQTIALEACKQCQRNTLLEIKPITTLPDILIEIKGPTCIMLYEKEEEVRLKDLLRNEFKTKEEIFLIVGPEGGFSENEVEKARNNGTFIATLGSRILRTETASLIGAALVLYELGDLG